MQAHDQGKKKLLVLGGGYGGLGIVRRLQLRKDVTDKLEITLVDKKEYYENVLASARSLAVPDFLPKMVRKYTEYLDNAEFICGEVKSVNHYPQEVAIDIKGQSIILSYDYLIICLGASYPYFKPENATIEERTTEVNGLISEIKKAETIMIVGGRAIGAEIVGEISETYPDKKITLVHSRSALMDFWPESGIDVVNEYMKKYNVDVILNKRLLRSEGKTHYFSDGSTLEADLKIETTGGKPNTAAFSQNFSKSLTEFNYLRINQFQQLLGHNNIFVMGDLCDTPLNKNAVLIFFQVPIVEHNLLALLNNNPETFCEFDKRGFKLTYPYHISMGAEYGVSIEPKTEQGLGSREIGQQITNKYHHIVNMDPSDFDRR